MSNTAKWIVGVIVVVLVVVGIAQLSGSQSGSSSNKPTTVGVVAPLSGDSAYYGESVRAGIKLAQSETSASKKGIRFKFQGGGLSSQKSLSAAQKLVNANDAKILYTIFTNAARSVASKYGGSNILQLYVAAPTSPLERGDNVFQTAFSYEKGCAKVSRTLKERGVQTVGMLNLESEFTELCKEGVSSVYDSSNIVVESYQQDATDFRTVLTKMNNSGVGAIFHVSFAGKVETSIQQISELGIDTNLIALRETLPKELVNKYASSLEGAIRFGFKNVSKNLKNRLDSQLNGSVANYQAAALSYLHGKQFVTIAEKCSNIECMKSTLSQTSPRPVLSFNGFQDRIAQFPINLTQWNGSEFEEINNGNKNQ